MVGIENLFQFCECQTIDELNIGNHIQTERSEAEKYEFIQESCVFSLLFFQPYIRIQRFLKEKLCHFEIAPAFPIA